MAIVLVRQEISHIGSCSLLSCIASLLYALRVDLNVCVEAVYCRINGIYRRGIVHVYLLTILTSIQARVLVQVPL